MTVSYAIRLFSLFSLIYSHVWIIIQHLEEKKQKTKHVSFAHKFSRNALTNMYIDSYIGYRSFFSICHACPLTLVIVIFRDDKGVMKLMKYVRTNDGLNLDETIRENKRENRINQCNIVFLSSQTRFLHNWVSHSMWKYKLKVNKKQNYIEFRHRI